MIFESFVLIDDSSIIDRLHDRYMRCSMKAKIIPRNYMKFCHTRKCDVFLVENIYHGMFLNSLDWILIVKMDFPKKRSERYLRNTTGNNK